MVSPVTHLRRSLHPLSPGGAPEVAVTSWYDARLQTWRATSPDYPYFAEARPRAVPEVFLTRRHAVRRLLANLDRALRDSPCAVPARAFDTRDRPNSLHMPARRG